MSKQAWIRSATCPQCKHEGEVRPIMYGMPSNNVDLDDVELGGCCVSSAMPHVACRACGWRGTEREVRLGVVEAGRGNGLIV